MRIGRAFGLKDGAGAEFLDASSVVAFIEVSAAGTITRANARFVRLLGHGSERDVLGLPLTSLVDDRTDWPLWRESALTGLERGVRLTFRGAGGAEVVLAGDLFPPRDRRDGSLAGVFIDVTEEEKLRAAAQRAARMEALGSMTGGIAHDLNNHLTVLVGNLYLAAEDHREDRETFRKLKAARDAAKRGADLIRQLLTFARREAFEMEIVDPVQVVANLVPLLRRAISSRIKLETRMHPESGTVRCNAAQLESAIVNLSVNARDAIEGNGRIAVSIEPVQLDAGGAEKRGVRPGQYVRIEIVDDGCGVAPDDLPRVFEPFYTTKGGNGGTGLGLSMVRWFARQAGGSVHLQSWVGKGTAVSLLLPRSEEGPIEPNARTAPLSTLRGGDERVLVLARDENVQWTVRQVLETLGYDVTVTAESREAIERAEAGRVDMLLVDAAAQHDAERARLLAAARAANPKLVVVLAVDTADTARARRAPDADALLAKPFSIAELAEVLRGTFDRRT